MKIKERIYGLIKDAKQLFADIKGAEQVQKFALADGKEISWEGEFAEGVEIKMGETPAEDGIYELADGRKLTTKAGKYVSIELKKVEEAKDPLEKFSAELETLKADFAAQGEELKAVKANYTKVLEGNKVLMSAVEAVAENLEKEPAPVGGNEGSEMSKSDFIVAQIRSKGE